MTNLPSSTNSLHLILLLISSNSCTATSLPKAEACSTRERTSLTVFSHTCANFAIPGKCCQKVHGTNNHLFCEKRQIIFQNEKKVQNDIKKKISIPKYSGTCNNQKMTGWQRYLRIFKFTAWEVDVTPLDVTSRATAIQ